MSQHGWWGEDGVVQGSVLPRALFSPASHPPIAAILMSNWDSGGGPPSQDPFQGSLMAQQSRMSKLQGQLEACISTVQQLPSMQTYISVTQDIAELQRDLDITNRTILGMAARCEKLEAKDARCEALEAKCEALQARCATLEASSWVADNTHFQELVGVVTDLAGVVFAIAGDRPV